MVAKPHGPKYLLHKYWARKPASVVGTQLDRLLARPGLVLDPFCGSGVLLREAVERGHEALGFDINPIAALISRVTLDPPSATAFDAAAKEMLACIDQATATSYTAGTESVRYVVHALVTACPECNRRSASTQAERAGRRYMCSCGGRLRYNLASSDGTVVADVVVVGRKPRDSTAIEREEQRQRSSEALFADDPAPYLGAFTDNQRTLTTSSMTTRDLFTARNFSVLCRAFKYAESVEDARVREALLVALTGSAAQCSRLIADRGRLSTGGPAWTVPGFWVPPVHLETNPVLHLRARVKKVSAALAALAANRPPGRGLVEERDAQEALTDFIKSGKRADLVFLDPPYGDSVPYLEFSALWNGFLRRSPRWTADLSVSQRLQTGDQWSHYERGLARVLEGVRGAMASAGTLLVTFNSLDLRAWGALLSALQAQGFELASIDYQRPAVISAKAQLAPDGSYEGDFYAIYKPGAAVPVAGAIAQAIVREALRDAAVEADGQLTRPLATRIAIATWMRANGDAKDYHLLERQLRDAVEGRCAS